MSLTNATKNTSLAPYVKAKLTALGTDAGHIEAKYHSNVWESLNFENYVKERVGNNHPVWDYLTAVGGSLRKSNIEALEVHRCEQTEVPKILAKKNWSESHLATSAPKAEVERWVWISSGTMNILPGVSPEFFLLEQNGIELVSKMGYRPE